MDAQMSDVIVVLDKAYENDLAGAVAKLKNCGMQIVNTNDDTSVVEGQIETYRIHDLEQLDCVDYVRKFFTWSANYPPGDPRDRDGV
jgi:hypothetical protein